MTPILATDTAFGVVFGAFVVATLVLAVITGRWAIRKDRPGRAEWKARQLEERAKLAAEVTPPPKNGHPPNRFPGGQQLPRR